MHILFKSPSWIFSALVFVAISILIFLVLLWVIRKNLPHESLRKHHDVAGFVFSLVGVLYSVILGFTVINVQTRYNEADQIIHTEAMALADIYQTASFFPAPFQNDIRSSLRKYINYVVDEEWHAEKSSQSRRLGAQASLGVIWNSYQKMEVPDLKASIWYTQSIEALDRLMDARLSRAFNSWEHLSAMMWSILLSGAFLTVCFMFFFSLENFRLQMLMTSLLAGYLSFMLFLVYTLDHVYEGPEGIQPVALQEIVTLFDKWDES